MEIFVPVRSMHICSNALSHTASFPFFLFVHRIFTEDAMDLMSTSQENDFPASPYILIQKTAYSGGTEISMDTIVIVGYIAGALTTISFVPQVMRAWKLKETRDLSLAMLILFATGILLWTCYGVWTESLPIIAANVITFVLILVLLGLMFRYK